MKDSWDYNLMNLLQEAWGGNPENLEVLLKKYAPFAVANADFSRLLFLRHFEVRVWEEQRSVMNCAPETRREIFSGALRLLRLLRRVAEVKAMYTCPTPIPTPGSG